MSYKIIRSNAPVHYRAAVYCRLSKDDLLEGESASIENQREMLTMYCEAQGWEVAAVYQDDGFTGLTQNRPALQAMLRDAEAGKFNLVITKDQSRLGRDHLQTSYLMEEFFPRHDIRYVAMNDGTDTQRGDDGMAAIRNVFNEMYSHDISRKVHSSYHLKAVQGKFTGCLAPIGYKKDPDCPGHLIIDEDTAPIVRYIFSLAAAGHGPNYIRRKLERRKMPCPTWWNRRNGLRNTYTKWEIKDPENGRYVWDFTVLQGVLANPVYYGAMASQKKVYRFKLGVVGEKPPEEWVIVENTHEPLVDKTTWDFVQETVRKRKHETAETGTGLFSGVLHCGECGKAILRHKTHECHPKEVFVCKTYNSYGKQHCSQHRVDYNVLYQAVLNEIRYAARLALADEDEMRGQLEDGGETRRTELDSLRHSVEKDESRLSVLERLTKKLYEDLIEGRVDEETFSSLLAETQQEQKDLKARIDASRQLIARTSEDDDSSARWMETMRQYADIEELNWDIVHQLISDILIHEQIDEAGVRHITIDIQFNFTLPAAVGKTSETN